MEGDWGSLILRLLSWGDGKRNIAYPCPGYQYRLHTDASWTVVLTDTQWPAGEYRRAALATSFIQIWTTVLIIQCRLLFLLVCISRPIGKTTIKSSIILVHSSISLIQLVSWRRNRGAVVKHLVSSGWGPVFFWAGWLSIHACSRLVLSTCYSIWWMYSEDQLFIWYASHLMFHK